MGDPALAVLFEAAPAERFRFRRAGSLVQYPQWLQGLDIGLAPLLPTDYNCCRSDVKFLEYAAHSVVPVLQRLDPYVDVVDGVTGFLFADPAQMLSVLDRLLDAPALRREVAANAYGLVARERRLDAHIGDRLAFYRRVQAAMKPAVGPVPEPLRRVGEHLHHLDLDSPADQQRAAGVDALQAEDLARAEAAFREAVRLDLGDPHAHAFLGLCHLKQGRAGQAQAALEQASALDPLLSRPVRALARLHRQAAEHYGQLACQLNPPEGSGAPP